jgi:hypothetical protein
MNDGIVRGLPVALAFVGIVSASGAHAQAPGPFAKVPPPTTACYSDKDPFQAKLQAARDAVAADKEKQEAINARIESDFNGMDMMEKSQRMTQWMMDNPQDAQKYMQANQAAGDMAQTEVGPLSAQETKLQAGYEDLIKRYEAAMAQALAPARARMAALDKRMAGFGCSFGSAECEHPPWAQPELEAVLRMSDQAYQAACPQWWGAKGQVQAYLTRRRNWLVNEYLPAFHKIDAVTMQQYAIMNTPAASYQSTLPHQKADRYINDVDRLYAIRPDKPYCTAQGCDGFLPAVTDLGTGRP